MSPTTADSLASLRAGLGETVPEARPLMRWWWFGPDVETAEIDRELRAMAAAGLGGVEVSFVHPMRPGAGRFLDEPLLGALRHAAGTARELGLRFDVTLGSGWSYGGPHIGPEHASRCLRWERRDLPTEAFDLDLVSPWPGVEPVAAFLGDGFPPSAWEPLALEPAALDPSALEPSGRPADGAASAARRLRIPVGRGPRTVLIAWSEPTGQQVKRAAHGAEGYVLDHLSAEATRAHLETVGEALLGAVPAELLGSVFCDSLEVYRADRTPRLPEEFRARRGYELLPHLHRLVVDLPGESGTGSGGDGPGPGAPSSERLRIDVGRTLSELVEEEFVATCRAWAAEHGVRFRLQGYGQPPITLSAQAGADLIEGEGCGWTGLTQTRWASSAAHRAGRRIVSSEVWTWVHSPSFRATPMDLKGEAHEHLLLGIDQFVGHGWPYSPPDAEGLGWVFYAAGALDDRNPWWPAMPQLSAYLTRLCWWLRHGEPAADVALLLPYDDACAGTDPFASDGAAGGRPRHEPDSGAPGIAGGLDLWRTCRDLIGEDVPAAIRRAGYDVDAVDDRALAQLVDQLAGRITAPRILVIPGAMRMPERTRALVERFRELGGTVLHAPADAEGLVEALRAVTAPPLDITGGGGEIGVVHRRFEDGDLLFVANTGPEIRTLRLGPRTDRGRWEIWDAADGGARPVHCVDGALPVTLHPYQAIVLVGTDGPAPRVGAPAPEDGAELVLDALQGEGPAAAGGRDVREIVLDLDESWFAPGARIVLDLGPCTPAPRPADADGYRVEVASPVREIAVVSVGGRGASPVQVGVLWDAPFTLDLTDHLLPGRSLLRLEVHGTAAPALAADEHLAGTVRATHEAYGERFQVQQLDRALDGVGHGIPRAPRLRRIRIR